MNVIGISGKAGSGKDTVADMLLRNEGIVKVSLADPIKRLARELWEFTDGQLWGPSDSRNAPDYRYPITDDLYLTPRKVLQHLGTEGGRAIDHDVWIRYAMRVATQLLEAKPRELCYSQSGGLDTYIEQYPLGREFERLDDFPEKVSAVILPDCRFVNELMAIKNAGGVLIRVKRPGAGLEGDFATHRSETELDNIPDSTFTYVIENTGTLEDLQNSVNNIVTEIYKK
jgi:hypothetical protein